MSYGMNATNLYNAWLNTLGGASFVAPGVWVQLHTGDPGVAQTANLSSNTTRNQIALAPASAGTVNLASSPAPWNMSATETIAAISLWSAASSGLPYGTVQLTSGGSPAPQAVTPGDTFTLLTLVLSLGPPSV